MLRKTLRFVCVILGSLLLLHTSGCRTTANDRQLVWGELDSQLLLERMQAGETSRAEEQAFIVKNHQAWTDARAARGLVNPTAEGPLASRFQELRARAPAGAFRLLPWVWLQLAVSDPGLDLRKGSVQASAPTHAR